MRLKSLSSIRYEQSSTRAEIVKLIIACKKADEEAVKKRAENRAQKEQLLALLAEKQLGKLSKLSEKDIQTRILALEA